MCTNTLCLASRLPAQSLRQHKLSSKASVVVGGGVVGVGVGVVGSVVRALDWR